MAKKWIKLGIASNFWDPTQEEVDSQTIVGNQVKLLEVNATVKSKINAEALAIATDEEVEEYKAFKAKEDQAFADKKVAVSTKDSQVAQLHADRTKLISDKDTANAKLVGLKSDLEAAKEAVEKAEDKNKAALQKKVDAIQSNVNDGEAFVTTTEGQISAIEKEILELTK